MASFGGETPVNIVSETVAGQEGNVYTVPSGRYFIGRIFGISPGDYKIRIDGFLIFDLNNDEEFNEEIILSSGDTVGTIGSNGAQNFALLRGREYNNP